MLRISTQEYPFLSPRLYSSFMPSKMSIYLRASSLARERYMYVCMYMQRIFKTNQKGTAEADLCAAGVVSDGRCEDMRR